MVEYVLQLNNQTIRIHVLQEDTLTLLDHFLFQTTQQWTLYPFIVFSKFIKGLEGIEYHNIDMQRRGNIPFNVNAELPNHLANYFHHASLTNSTFKTFVHSEFHAPLVYFLDNICCERIRLNYFVPRPPSTTLFYILPKKLDSQVIYLCGQFIYTLLLVSGEGTHFFAEILHKLFDNLDHYTMIQSHIDQEISYLYYTLKYLEKLHHYSLAEMAVLNTALQNVMTSHSRMMQLQELYRMSIEQQRQNVVADVK